LRCDCGVQLRLALRIIAAHGRGVLIYATGHEGRGIGLVNKLRAYVAQDAGADTVDANVELGLPIDSRDYGETAAVLAELGIRSIRLLTNNPRKVEGLRAAGTAVNAMAPLVTAPHHRNVAYLNTKARRLDHVRPTGAALFLDDPVQPEVDVSTLLGDVNPRPDRPFVVVKFAQTLDGRIATSNGDSKWISGMPERRLTHALRAACDAVMVGIGTVLSDDPQLTVRHVPGASPMRVVLDSRLRVPLDAHILRPDAATTIVTSERSDPERRAALRERGVKVDVVARHGRRLSLPETFARLLAAGTDSVLIEGGSRTITEVLAAGLVDRMIVSIAPTVIGSGTQAVDDLGTRRIADGIRLENRVIFPVGDDVVLAWDVAAS
jgi:3,4-dihydroxy 2-butanone 4-phosphate synthase/GTP cyclohydrolase II